MALREVTPSFCALHVIPECDLPARGCDCEDSKFVCGAVAHDYANRERVGSLQSKRERECEDFGDAGYGGVVP